ncbi:MAG TPA: Holliday junction branch migration protein RuvA [Chitinophagaceae bacterium]|nr:Holliday junction branch migration protein RuvA [Chitinophagaceae bacterium]
MYAYLQGKITYKSPSLLYLDVNGLAYEVNITLRTYDKIQALDECRLYTHVKVSEDAWTLYGFAEEAERTTFRQLLSINGVGAGTARIILSSLSPAELERAIVTEDTGVLEKVKGIGAKTAQRIILELKGKINVKTTVLNPNNSAETYNTKANDALIALVNLGINKTAAEAALKKAGGTDLPVEELIKQALRNL